SSTMRCMRTEPTIPRQPIKPTFFISVFSCKDVCCINVPVSSWHIFHHTKSSQSRK
ncbi:hypothetical protein AZZ66_002561, partial [Escherichia coli]